MLVSESDEVATTGEATYPSTEARAAWGFEKAGLFAAFWRDFFGQLYRRLRINVNFDGNKAGYYDYFGSSRR